MNSGRKQAIGVFLFVAPTGVLVVGFTVAFTAFAAVTTRARRPSAAQIAGHEPLLVAGFFVLGAAPTVGCAALGALLGHLFVSDDWLEAAVDAGLRAASSAFAGAVFVMVGHSSQADVWAGVVAVVAVVVGSMFEACVRVELQRVNVNRAVLLASVMPVTIVAAGVAPLGYAGLLLSDLHPAAVLLLVPVGIAVIGPGRWAVREREQRRQAELVLEASTRAAGLRSFNEALAIAAHEALGLCDASAAVCCATGPGGEWAGMVVDGAGAHAASADAIAVLRELADEDDAAPETEIDLQQRLLPVRLALPPAKTVGVAAAIDSAVPVILAVLRDVKTTGGEARVSTLRSFVSQVSLSVANARLYEDVETAYRQQLDLNRQKGEFVATVSHELRTPVAAIMGTLETVVRLGDRLDATRRAELLSSANEYGDRLTRVIDELLLVAAAEQSTTTMSVRRIDVHALAAQIVAETEAITDGRAVAIVSPALQHIRTDEQKLTRILVNLMENAAKYAPDGPIELEIIPAGRRAVFFVTDHGPGIAPDDRDRVFERFVQLDQSLTRANGGLGLGLYLCRQLAGLLSGELVVTETPGGGCTFCLAIDRSLEGTSDDQGEPQGVGGVLRRPLPKVTEVGASTPAFAGN